MVQAREKFGARVPTVAPRIAMPSERRRIRTAVFAVARLGMQSEVGQSLGVYAVAGNDHRVEPEGHAGVPAHHELPGHADLLPLRGPLPTLEPAGGPGRADHLDPLSYGVDGLRGAFIDLSQFGVGFDFAILAALAACFLALGARAFLTCGRPSVTRGPSLFPSDTSKTKGTRLIKTDCLNEPRPLLLRDQGSRWV